jgi:alpha-L-rhamnosidase
MGLEGQVRAGPQPISFVTEHGFTAEMIAPSCDAGTGGPGCSCRAGIRWIDRRGRAVLHLSAQGLYRAFLNGVRVGDDLLTPAGPATTTASPISPMT